MKSKVGSLNAAPFTVTATGDWLVGPARYPGNNSQHEAGTIHDDATARTLGFRSGTVAGSIHMEQFVPLCEHVFGREWSESGAGSLSLYFLNPSIDQEPVYAMVAQHEIFDGVCRRRQVTMKTAAGVTVLEGTASIGEFDQASAVRLRLQSQLSRAWPPVAPRILAQVSIGFSATHLPTRILQADIDARLEIITEKCTEFSVPGMDGHTVAPLSAAVHAMRVFEDKLAIGEQEFVGMFGAIDWQYLRGPVWADYPYEVSGQVLAITDSPKTEILWYECILHDPATSQDVARMLMMSRLLKSTSSLWKQQSLIEPGS